MPEPDSSGIQALEGHLNDVWARARQRWSAADSLYTLQFEVWNPKQGRPTFRPSKARAIVDHAMNNLLSYDPIPHREPAGEGEEHKVRANKIEPFVKAMFETASQHQMYIPLRQLGGYMTLYGYGVLEGALLTPGYSAMSRPKPDQFDDGDEYEQALMDHELDKRNLPPFSMLTPHPATVLMAPTERHPKQALKRVWYFGRQLQDLLAVKVQKGRRAERWLAGANPYERIECLEYWDRYWHALMMKAGQMLLLERNTWGFVPFSHSYSGWGLDPVFGEAAPDPYNMAVGILDAIHDSLKMHAQQVSGRHVALLSAVFPKVRTTKDAAELKEEMDNSDIIGNVAEGDVGWLKSPDFPSWMLQAEKDYMEDIEFGTFASSLGGLRQQGVTTVGQQAILDNAASKKFISVLKGMEYLASTAASNGLRLIDVTSAEEPDGYTINGHKLSAKDIEHDYNISVGFKVVDPVLHLQEKELAMREYQAKLISKEDYWEVAGKEDSTGMRRRLLEDEIWDDPRVKQLMAGITMEKMGLEGIAEGGQNPNMPGNGADQGFTEELAQGTQFPPGGVPTAAPAMPGSPQAAAQAVEEMRQPLSDQVAKPGLVNPGAFAGR